MYRKNFTLVILVFLLFSCHRIQQQDTIILSEEDLFVTELVSQMTMEEKLGQLSQATLWSRGGDDDKLKDDIRQGHVGSFLNAGDRAKKLELQKVAIEESRLGIPLIFGRDVIHGHRTVLPIPLGQAASWNMELIEKAHQVVAAESYQDGIHWTFAPMLDITRDPRWGRIAECPGEDPYLGGKMAVAMINGLQGSDLSAPNTIAACAKHYVGYGATEGGRDYNTTIISENELRNIYLPSFHESVKAGVATIMSAFNDINGIPASGNEHTLRKILRDEWGFDGIVVSDWESMEEMMDHGFCADEKEVALKSIKAGVDLEMVSVTYQDHLEELIQTGLVDAQLIDESVANIIRIKYRLGLFENPYPPVEDESIYLSPEHLKIAQELTTQSLVLLKNDNSVLPLADNVQKVAIIGPLADSPKDQLGCWVADGKPEDTVTPLAAFQNNVEDKYEIVYAKGMENARSIDTVLFENAVEAAEASDVALLFVGENESITGEARCRAFIDLPGNQSELVKTISATGTPVVLVVQAGRPLTFPEVIPDVDAIIYAWHPGTMGGPAIYDVIAGNAVPSGKLTVTIPRTVGQIPLYYNHRSTGRPPSPDILGIPLGTPEDPVDYVSYYLDADFTPQYPFGYGLSYSSFDYSNLKLSSTNPSLGQDITVNITVENTGAYDAVEIVQLYIQDIAASITRPVKELKGFQRIDLESGEKKTIHFTLTNENIGFYDNDGKFNIEPGDFKIMVGGSSLDSDLLTSMFRLEK